LPCELALRQVAQTVDRSLESHRAKQGLSRTVAIREKIGGLHQLKPSGAIFDCSWRTHGGLLMPIYMWFI
jgi:hypothetical protein